MRSCKRLVLFSLIAINFVEQPAPEVTIDQGTLSGRVSGDGRVLEYLGIPYATTNQSARFRAPLPPPKWQGVFKAIDDSTACPQDNFVIIRGTEDCLKINVYVPAFARRPLPVMVFIHEGAFFLGDGGKFFHGPKFLLQYENVILVTFNYRLGVLGFLCLGIEEAPGNAGLKDQLAALRWVKRNIGAFGGDSEKITAFGISAGASSLSLLIASGKLDGLIQRAIFQSGSALAHWTITRKPVWVANFVLKSLGYDTEDPYELYKILNSMSYKQLAALPHDKPVEPFLDTQLIHLPCIEKIFPGTESIITDYPYNLLKKNPTNISIIHGTTSQEGLFFVSYDTDEIMHYRNGKYLVASDLEFRNEEEAQAVTKQLHDFYFHEETISKKTALNLSELYKHLHFEVPSLIESEIYAERSNAKVYNYYFNYSGNRNYLKLALGYNDVDGACHGDDIMYLFDAAFWQFTINKNDELMIERLTTMWTNFAKYGDPTPTTTKILPVRWLPSKKEKLGFLYIDYNLRMADLPSPAAYAMWKNIYSQYRKTRL